MLTPLEFSMKNPNTKTGINNKSKRMPVSVWSSFAIQFDEKLKVESGLGWSFVLSQVLLRYVLREKKRYYLGIFPNMGGGLPKSQNFCKFTKYFFVCQIHSEVLKHVLQMGG